MKYASILEDGRLLFSVKVVLIEVLYIYMPMTYFYSYTSSVNWSEIKRSFQIDLIYTRKWLSPFALN